MEHEEGGRPGLGHELVEITFDHAKVGRDLDRFQPGPDRGSELERLGCGRNRSGREALPVVGVGALPGDGAGKARSIGRGQRPEVGQHRGSQ